MNDALIELKGVTKRFKKNTVLDSIDLKIPQGKITGIIGASGEGKSTILKLIASFYKPNSGEITYFNRDIFKSSREIRVSFGFAIEDGSFYEDLSVEENLLYFGELYGFKGDVLRERIEELIKFVGLENAKKILAKNLSLGMKKRLDIACSLVHKPSVLILDEPTADLDPLLRFQIMKLIKKINLHGTTVLFTTQLLGEAEGFCDKIAILYNEKIIEDSPPAKIKQKYKAKDLNDAFRKIFSKKGRKTYQESKKKKTLLKIEEKPVEKQVKEEKVQKGNFWKKDEEEKITKKEIKEAFTSKKKGAKK